MTLVTRAEIRATRWALAAAAQASTTTAATQAPPRMPAARCKRTSATAEASATSASWRVSSESAPSTTSSTKIPSAKPATPPGDGETASELHCAASTIGTSTSATPSPDQRAAPAERRTAAKSNNAPAAQVPKIGASTRQSDCPAP